MTSRKRKILLFIKVPPPLTGATMMNLQIYQSTLLNKTHDLDAILISYSKDFNEHGKIKLGKAFIFLRTVFTLVSKLLFNRPDYVYFQISPTGLVFYRDLFYATIIKLFGLKTLFHLHGKGIEKKSKNSFTKWIYRFVFYRSELICLSEALKLDVVGVTSGPIHIVNNGIPIVTDSMAQLDFSSNINGISLLFVSNLLKAKGILDFLEVTRLLNEHKIPFNAHILGSERDVREKDICEFIRNNNLSDQVFYHGPKYDDEKFNYFQKCDVFILPTLNEAWGNVILEAMQFGKVVIATNEGSISEIIDNNKTGFIVNKNSPIEIVDKIRYLINNPIEIKRMGDNGRVKFTEKYTWKTFEDNLIDVFNKVVT